MGKYGQSSLTGYAGDVTVNLVIMALILCGGVGFIVWQDIFACRFDPKKFTLHTKVVLVMTGILLFSGAVLFLLFESGKTMPFGERILTAFFNSVTARTAGFNTVELAALSPASAALMIILMIIGGAPGSTAGGIKVTTFVTLLAGTLASARQVSATNIFKRRIEGDLVRQASAIATIYFSVVSLGIVSVAAIERIDLSWITFEVVSALSNVGVTMGITGSLSVASKLILCLLMYFGRVGMMSLVIALAAKRENIPISRPTENLLL